MSDEWLFFTPEPVGGLSPSPPPAPPLGVLCVQLLLAPVLPRWSAAPELLLSCPPRPPPLLVPVCPPPPPPSPACVFVRMFVCMFVSMFVSFYIIVNMCVCICVYVSQTFRSMKLDRVFLIRVAVVQRTPIIILKHVRM